VIGLGVLNSRPDSVVLAAVIERLGDVPGHRVPAGVPVTVLRRETTATTRLIQVRIGGPSGGTRLFVKQFLPPAGRPDEEARIRRYFMSECGRSAQACSVLAGHPALRATRVVASFHDLLAVVSAAEPGVSLERALRHALLFARAGAIRRAIEALARVGEWVRRFQQGVPVRSPAPQMGREFYREYIDVRLRSLVQRGDGCFSEANRAALLGLFDRLARTIDPADFRVVAIHADLCPANVLVRDDGISVIDFADSADGNPMTDLAHLDFHVHQSAARWRVAADLRSRLQRALLCGYDTKLTVADALFRVMAFQQYVCCLTAAAAAVGRRALPLQRLLFNRRVAGLLAATQRLVEPRGALGY
jgi:hypothetical protein